MERVTVILGFCTQINPNPQYFDYQICTPKRLERRRVIQINQNHYLALIQIVML